MGVRRSEERLAEAAKLYYVDELNQEEVATALGTTRSNVSRMLQAARTQGIIKFHVTHPLTRQSALEQQMADTFGVAEAVVLAADAGVHILDRTGELAGRWLAERVADGQTFALAWGRTLKGMVEQVEVDRAYDVTVAQTSGDLDGDPRLCGHELVRELASRLGGQYSYLHAPTVVESPRVAADLLASRQLSCQLEKARQADLALVGVGAPGEGYASYLLESGQLSAEEHRELEAAAPAGDIIGRFFDARGRECGPLKSRVIGLDLDELRAIPTVAGVAAGPHKARAMWAALRGGLLDVVICDQSAAAAALHLERGAA